MTSATNTPVSLPSQGGDANRETTLPMMPGACDLGRGQAGQGQADGTPVSLDPKFTSGHDAR